MMRLTTRWPVWLEQAVQDARYAVHSLRRNTGFSLVAVLTLAVGIGVTAAIYGVVDAVLFQPLPFPDSDRLVRIVENLAPSAPGRPVLQRGLTYAEFVNWRGRAKTLSDTTAVIGTGQSTVRTSHGFAGLWGTATATNTFTLLGARTMLGRNIDGGDDTQPDVIVLSFDTWQRHFDADPGVVGRVLELRPGALMGPAASRFVTVVGVLPAEFELPTGPSDFYVPFVPERSKGSPRVTLVARLAPGVSVEIASQEANLIGPAIASPAPTGRPALQGPRFDVQSLKELAVRDVRPALRVLVATVMVVLLVVCANVANLLLARGAGRRRELVVRLAIGATRGRVARQLLTEALVLAMAAGVLGALVAAGAVALVKQLAAVEAPGIFRLMFSDTALPRVHEVGANMKLFGMTFVIAAFSSVLFGLLPALQLSRQHHSLRAGSRSNTGGRIASRIRVSLVVGQLVMATALLVGAGLLAHSFVRLSRVNKGYDASNVLTLNLLFPNEYPPARKAETIERLLERFRAIPGVEFAGFARHGVLIGEELTIGTFVPPGRTFEAMQNERSRVRSVSAGYLRAMGAPFLDGRDIDSRDGPTTQPVVVLSRSAARMYFGAERAVGQSLDWRIDDAFARVEVVGVVEDVRQESLADEVFPEVFAEYRQFMSMLASREKLAPRQNPWAIGFLSFALRTAGSPASVAPAVHRNIADADPNVGIDAMIPASRLVSSSLARQRFSTVLLGALAGVAGFLALIGIYSVMTYAVIQRTQEIGIRMALGAQRSQVVRMVLRNGFALATAGIVLGLGAAVAGTRLLQGMLFGITPLDLRTFAAVAAMFLVVATAACYVPARRATKVDPLIALRSE